MTLIAFDDIGPGETDGFDVKWLTAAIRSTRDGGAES